MEKDKLFDCEMKSMFCAGWVWCIIKGIGTFLIQMLFKRGVNPEFLKFIDRCNFWIFTVTYIKLYIFGKEITWKKSLFWLKIFVTS